MLIIAARTTRAARALTGWPVSSQHTACRNALLASTALSHRRREREEVEEFLEAHYAASPSRATTRESATRLA